MKIRKMICAALVLAMISIGCLAEETGAVRVEEK